MLAIDRVQRCIFCSTNIARRSRPRDWSRAITSLTNHNDRTLWREAYSVILGLIAILDPVTKYTLRVTNVTYVGADQRFSGPANPTSATRFLNSNVITFAALHRTLRTYVTAAHKKLFLWQKCAPKSFAPLLSANSPGVMTCRPLSEILLEALLHTNSKFTLANATRSQIHQLFGENHYQSVIICTYANFRGCTHVLFGTRLQKRIATTCYGSSDTSSK